MLQIVKEQVNQGFPVLMWSLYQFSIYCQTII
nr:MAG TPA: butirosin biosynthesis protein [Caudoviricetes sp.]